MGLFDFLKKNSDATVSNASGFSLNVTVAPPEVIPVEQRIKDAVISTHGLYPHEVLLLDYAPKYYTDENNFQSFWWYNYGVKDVASVLKSLEKRGFIAIGDIKSTLEGEKLDTLKNILKSRGVKSTGKKADIIDKLIAEVPENELSKSFSRRKYKLTELGEQVLKTDAYVPYIHHHGKEDLNIWTLNKLVYSGDIRVYRDKIWAHLNQRSQKLFSERNFGLYRNCRYSMASFLREENKLYEAISMLSEVVFWDLCGAGNNYDPRTIDISAQYFFPYDSSNITLAPGIIRDICDIQTELGLSEEQLKATLLERINRLTAPLVIFEPTECYEIFKNEKEQNIDALKKIYAKARRRFKEKYPHIKV